jgi:membrane-anchored mycosin MYCP
VVAVGTVTKDGVPAGFTPPNVQWIDTMAPGVGVVSTFVKASVNVADDVDEPEDRKPFNGWASWSGTSFSAALVSGVIAARTIPGQVSSRQAWDAILDDARKAPSLAPVVELSWPVPQAE